MNFWLGAGVVLQEGTNCKAQREVKTELKIEWTLETWTRANNDK